MGFVPCDPERRDLAQTLLFSGSIVGQTLLHRHRAKLDYSFLRFHTFSTPPGSLFSSLSDHYNDPPGARAPDPPQEAPAKPNPGQGSGGCCSGSMAAAVAGPELSTVGRNPGPLPCCGGGQGLSPED